MKLKKDDPQVVALMDRAHKAEKVADDLLKVSKDEDRPLTSAELTTARAAMADAKLNKGLADDLVDSSFVDHVGDGGVVKARRPAGDGDVDGSDGSQARAPAFTKSDRREIFRQYLIHGRGAQSHFAKTIPNWDEKANSISELYDPEAGYLVQNEERSTEFIQRIRDEVEISKMAREIRIAGRSISFPNLEFSGSAIEVEEDGVVVERNWGDIIGRTMFTPQTFADAFFFPRDWAEDAIMDVEALLIDLTVTLHAEKVEEEIVNGTGARGPLGLYQAPFNTFDTTNATLVLEPEDFRALPYQIKKQYRRGAGYILSRPVVEQVALMRSDSGAGAGTGDFLWRMGMEAGQPDRLNGFPILESEFVPAFTDVEASPAALFGDLRWYWIVTRRDVRFQRLTELRALTREIGILSDFRFDGAPVLKEPFVKMVRKA